MANRANVRLRDRCGSLLFAAMAAVICAPTTTPNAAASNDDPAASADAASTRYSVSPGLGLKLTAAGDEGAPAPVATETSGGQNAISKYFSEWFQRSDRAKESQPHWMTPVVTVTPRLEQEYRYDQQWQIRPNGVSRENFGINKGLELIPTEQTELIISVPSYIKDTTSTGMTEGWADETFLVKLRLLSENEEHGNYIVTAFLGVAIPTGSAAFTTNQTVWTPTIAAGKGWGTRESGFDIQSTLSISYGDVNQAQIGEPIIWNTAFQAHVFDKLWPEIEFNYTHYEQGPNAGKSQSVITTGLILGRYQLIDRVKFVFGFAYQEAVSSFRTFNSSWILSARAPF
ncbi:MAG TPA: hypothetical protein VMH26_15350 [Burkholderiales bacterium]|nr:hypothetical protein [Burkholderiales bacterium]